MNFPYRSYDLALRALRLLSPLVAGGDSKLARGVKGRRRTVRRLEEWARTKRRPDRPLVWLHAPSVGEGLQARAIAEALRARREDLQVVYTYFSPSAEGWAKGMPAEVTGYLPWDTGKDVGPALEALRPALLAFTKTEVWPRLARDAARMGTPVVLTAATLPPGAGRLRGPARHLLRPVFGSLDAVLAIAPDDAERFHQLAVPSDRIQVTGDPAVDSASRRAMHADPETSYLAPFSHPERPTLVAGSTWGPDEEVLVPAASRVRRDHPDLRLLIAPHEPTEAHLEGLERELSTAGWTTARLGGVEERGEVGMADAVLVDRVGVLAQLYTVGEAAYVGGGFHRHGLHSVLGPAATGRPVVFGPGHSNARAAGDLLREGGARMVSDSRELAVVLGEWFDDSSTRGEAGDRALEYIRRHLGAAGRTAEILEELLPPVDGARARSDDEDTKTIPRSDDTT